MTYFIWNDVVAFQDLSDITFIVFHRVVRQRQLCVSFHGSPVSFATKLHHMIIMLMIVANATPTLTNLTLPNIYVPVYTFFI
jgi:hypothetical protein